MNRTTIYQRGSDNVAKLATISVQSGTPDADYPPTLLVDDNPAKVAKITSAAGAWLLTFLAKQPAELIGLVHHSFDDTQDVRIQASNDPGEDWTAPPFDAAIPVPPALGTGNARWTQNPWLDLTQQAGYDAAGWKYYRLVVGEGSQTVELGQLWLGLAIRRLDPDLNWGAVRAVDKPAIVNQTGFGVRTVYSRGTTLWRSDAELWEDDDLRGAMDAQWYGVDGQAAPFLFIPDGDVNLCYLVRWDVTEVARTWAPGGVWQRKVTIRELARGLRPGGTVPLPVPVLSWLFSEASGQQAFNQQGPMTPSGNLLIGNQYGLGAGSGDAMYPTQVNVVVTNFYDARATRIVSAGGSVDCYLSGRSFVFAGAQYTASAYVKSNTGSDVTFKMWKLGGGDNIQSSDLTAPASGYARVTFTFTATAGSSPFLPFYTNAVGALDISMRDLKLEQAAAASAYVPDAFDFTLGLTGAADSFDPTWAPEGLAFAGDNHFGIAQGATPQAFSEISIYVVALVNTNSTYRPLLSTPFDDGKVRLAAAQNSQPRAHFDSADAVANAATVANGRWHVHSMTYDGTTLKLFIDEACLASTDASSLSVADIYTWYLANFNTLGLDGSIGLAQIYDAAHSARTRAAVLTALRAIMAGRSVTMTALPTWCAFEGDSIMAGLAASDGDHALPLLALRDLSPTPQGRNLAISGSSMSDLVTRAAALDAVLVSGATNILTVLDGANDLGGSETAAAFVADLKAYCQARQVAGWKVVVCTVLPRTNVGFNTKRNAANVLIRADASFYDALADIGDTGSTMGADAAASDGSLYGDGTHPTDDGYAALHATVSAAIGSLV